MRSLVALLCLLYLQVLHAQVIRDGAANPSQNNPSLPTVRLTFSDPNLDSPPLQLPWTMMDAGPFCAANETAFLEFRLAPTYFQREVYSITPDGKVVRYPVERIMGLTDIRIVSYDPGLSEAALLLRARSTSQKAENYYLALFDYNGELRSSAKLDVGFKPSKIAQQSDDSFIVIGSSPTSGQYRIVSVDSSGNVQRNLDARDITLSKKDLTAKLQAFHGIGPKPDSFPEATKLSFVLSSFQIAHSADGLLVVQPDVSAQVVEFLRSGETRIVPLRLPKDQVADSLIPDGQKWLVRTSVGKEDSISGLFEVDPTTGETLREVSTSGVPPSTILCPSSSGLYGLKWIDQKPYLIFGSLQ